MLENGKNFLCYKWITTTPTKMSTLYLTFPTSKEIMFKEIEKRSPQYSILGVLQFSY